MKIELCNSQSVVNRLNEHPLIFDTRSKYQYHLSHIPHSINLPLDLCNDDFFLNWNDGSKVHIKNAYKRKLFESRKRAYVYIICSSETDIKMQGSGSLAFDAKIIQAYFKRYIEKLDSVKDGPLEELR